MKILLLKNYVINPDVLKQGIVLAKQYASTIGLSLDFFEVETTKQFTSVAFSNAPNNEGYVSGVQVTPQEVFDEAKRLGYIFDIDSVACLVYDRTRINPQPTNPIDNGVCIQIPCQWYMTFPDVFAMYLLHELCHYEASANGIPDFTHKKYDPMWNHQFDQKTDVSYYLFLLQKTLKPTSQIVTLNRLTDDGTQTTGKLTYGTFSCDTLERPWKNNLPNISCIPKGTYTVKYTFSFKFLKYTYELQNVKGRSGIRIHSANFYSQLLGCIALGKTFQDINGDGHLDVLNSRITVAQFEQLMGKKDFVLNIV